MLFPAGAAPCGPEVQHHRLAAVRRERDIPWLSHFLEREIRRAVADERRVDVLRIFTECKEERCDERRRDDASSHEHGAVHETAPLSATTAAVCGAIT